MRYFVPNSPVNKNFCLNHMILKKNKKYDSFSFNSIFHKPMPYESYFLLSKLNKEKIKEKNLCINYSPHEF